MTAEKVLFLELSGVLAISVLGFCDAISGLRCAKGWGIPGDGWVIRWRSSNSLQLDGWSDAGDKNH